MSMSAQKQLKLFQAKQAFTRQAEFIRQELLVCTRTEHLQPVVEFLEWLVRDMAEIAGVTAEVQAHAKEQAIIRAQIARRTQQLHSMRQQPNTRPKTPARPKLRLVK